MDYLPDEDVPTLPSGVTWLIDDSPHETAPQQLVLGQLLAERGRVFWVDARDVASTYVLHPMAPRPRLLSSLRIARAWTAYQHHTLIRRVVDRASPRTRLVFLPHICSLYRDDDVDDREADRLLAASLHTLSALADALSVPVLLTAPATERSILDPTVDHEVHYEATEFGYAFSGETFRTKVYHDREWWQTTIPYWVELMGAIRTGDESPWVRAAAHAGLETFV